MQTIAKVSLNAFINGFSEARDNNPMIAANTSTPDEIVEKICAAADAVGHKVGLALAVKRYDSMSRFFSKECHIRATFDGKEYTGGYIVLNGELLALHSTRKGSGEWLVRCALEDGANHLDCFDVDRLVNLYHKYGFVTADRVPNTTPGEPDVVYMVRPI